MAFNKGCSFDKIHDYGIFLISDKESYLCLAINKKIFIENMRRFSTKLKVQFSLFIYSQSLQLSKEVR